MGSRWVTVGFSTHRVESLEAAEAAMAGHRVVALEEPPTEGFREMLEGVVTIAEHLERLAPEFPEYSRRQCVALRRQHRQGVELVQVEPFMAELEAIHESFERGVRPHELESDPVRWRVYQAEHRWTGALLGYYAASHAADFDRVVDAVLAFARVDAERGRLRDELRARRLAELVRPGGLYAEAGSLHAGLVGALRRELGRGVPVRPHWLLAAEARRLGAQTVLLAPGDRLTISLARGSGTDGPAARLLAARSLIQVAISIREELVPSADHPFPHAVDEVLTCRLVANLGFEDCRRLYPHVRRLPPAQSRGLVERYTGAE